MVGMSVVSFASEDSMRMLSSQNGELESLPTVSG